MLTTLYNKLFGSANDRYIKRFRKMIDDINTLEIRLQELSDDELQDKFKHYKEVLTEHPERMNDYVIDVFAAIKNASRRLTDKQHTYIVRDKEEIWNMIFFDVQLIGGLVLHYGMVAEMRTGEGKTLVSTLPAILSAMTSKGVHMVTVNDYLATRDAEWMLPLYDMCGVSVGIVKTDSSPIDRKEAYSRDITYGTNNQFGFDYLRDNMVQNRESIVQRGHHYAIVDEVDSILIDESRTPLIISAPDNESTDKYVLYDRIVQQLVEDEHYKIDYKEKNVMLTKVGIDRVERILGVQNIYTEAGFDEVHHLENALKARITMEREKDYIVSEGEVIIVDPFTGRLTPGRRYGDGLHQALEAKEQVEIQRESKTLATISFQNYFRLYDRLAGMTGTAETEAEELMQIYNVDTVVIPTNKPIKRIDKADKIYKNEMAKYNAVVEDIKTIHTTGQPILVGTASIEKSELMSTLLQKAGVQHQVLNAKQHEKEASIVQNAGQKGAVMIATNMAGRGTDIKLTDETRALGGLVVLGTERHESRRIDNQLRGRSGRQGDIGASQFYVSMTDELMKRFGGDQLASLLNKMGMKDDEALEHSWLSNSVEQAQKRIEGYHFDSRKHVVQYDDVMNIHREKIYKWRRNVLFEDAIDDQIEELIHLMCKDLVSMYPADMQSNTPFMELYSHYWAFMGSEIQDTNMLTTDMNDKEKKDILAHHMLEYWIQRASQFPNGVKEQLFRMVFLRAIDELWIDHLTHL